MTHFLRTQHHVNVRYGVRQPDIITAIGSAIVITA